IKSVHQQNSVVREYIQELAESFSLLVVGHDPRVSLRAKGGDAKAMPGHHVGGALASANIGRACGEHAGFDAVRAARAKLDNVASSCGGDHPRRLASN